MITQRSVSTPGC